METSDRSPIRASLFPGLGPYIRILPVTPDQPTSYDPPPPPVFKKIVFSAPNGISPIVEESVRESGFSLATKHQVDNVTCIWETLPITEKGKDEINFANIEPGVKINQFPGLFAIGRKDYLALNYQNMREKYGQACFNFSARTFVLPDQYDECKSEMKSSGKIMIVKPPNYYCGIGIKLINNSVDLPQKKNRVVVQEYIDRPFLIRGLKFDLRIYVLMTSISPLRLYLYEDGLVRFATKEYSYNVEDIDNKFIHITNFSVNKNNKDFVYNENPGQYEGHKWNVKTLRKYFDEELGLDWRPVMDEIKNVCIKTVLTGREEMMNHVERQLGHATDNCFKLFGFDVMLDEDMRVWLLEVNNIPSLHINTIDAAVNRPMVAEMFNIVGLNIPKSVAAKTDISVNHQKVMTNDDLKMTRDDLSVDDLRMLAVSEDELSQCDQWTRIFPTSHTESCLQFYSRIPHRDRLLQSWETQYGGSEQSREAGRNIIRSKLQNIQL